jgi:hypothetical protein
MAAGKMRFARQGCEHTIDGSKTDGSKTPLFAGGKD